MTRKQTSRTSTRRLDFPGMHKVWSPATSTLYLYAYKGKGAPRVGKIEGCATKAEALKRLEDPQTAGRIAGRLSLFTSSRPAPGFIAALIADYKREHLPTMADSTQKLYLSHLNEIQRVFGTTSLAAIQKTGAKARIKKWHKSMAATPNKADKALTTLVGLFNFGKDREDMQTNPAAGIARLSEIGARAEITWPEATYIAARGALTPSCERALRLLWLTGLRPADAAQLRWNEVLWDKGYIKRRTNKSVKKDPSKKPLYARIPLTPELRELLNECPRNATTVLTTEKGGPFKSANSMNNGIMPKLRKHGLAKDLHLHDIRGTRATLHFLNGCSDEQAERYMGWAPGQGARMRGIYVNADLLAEMEAKAG